MFYICFIFFLYFLYFQNKPFFENGTKSINIEKSFINLKELITNLNKIEKTETETYEWKEFIDRFQLFILIAFILLMLEIIILEKKNNKLKF